MITREPLALPEPQNWIQSLGQYVLLQALEAPERIDRHGQLEASAELAAPAGLAPPPEPGERLWRGELAPDGDGGYVLHGETGAWPLITLEPALHHWLLGLEGPTPVTLIGCLNPWGPWLRVSRTVP